MVTVEETVEVLNKEIIEPIKQKISRRENVQVSAEVIMKGVWLMRSTYDDYTTGHSYYNFYSETVTSFLRSNILPNLLRPTDDIFGLFLNQWEAYKNFVYWMKLAFHYLERGYIELHKKDSLSKLAFTLFKEEAFQPVASKLGNRLINMIEDYRKNPTIRDKELSSAIHSFIEIEYNNPQIKKNQLGEIKWEGVAELRSFYKTFIEDPLLERSTEYFYVAAKNLNLLIGTEGYFTSAIKLFESEEQLVANLLHEATLQPLNKNLKLQIITSFKDEYHLYKVNFNNFFQDSNIPSLKNLYSNFEGDENMKSLFLLQLEVYLELESLYIIDQGKSLEPKDCIKAFLSFIGHADKIVKKCFGNNSDFKALKESTVKKVINSRADLALYTALFSDELLKGEISGLSEEDLDLELEKLTDLVSNISERDLFFANYAKLLASRLINDTGASLDAELSIISKFKAKCGTALTDKLNVMIHDIDISKDLLKKYNESKTTVSNFEFNVKILKSGGWPEQEEIKPKVPRDIFTHIEDFTKFYINIHTGRKLNWLYHLGSVEVKTLYLNQQYTLIMSPIQYIILWNINSEETKLSEIKLFTELPVPYIKMHLLSFFNPKHNLLLKESQGKKIGENEKIRFNLQFESKQKRLNFIIEPKKKAPKPSAVVDDNLMKERKYILEAHIVKFVKSKRLVNHHDLLANIMGQTLDFTPQPEAIKDSIEDLIFRGLIRRDEAQFSIYHYVEE
ncbi:unnamed protein product [Blepharisma stoltei]|uniref:Cullin family profile domain-containing protein n=1 Tax=Blepharisma stoltei TaxID=1481888 RepID=A0AAU9J675_9CILI|nr:unnamed protein product [Blepharisma stoltei]